MGSNQSSQRRHTSFLSLFLLGILFLSNGATAAVLGIDLGTEYIKTVLVKPGTPLEIVLGKDSKRKEPSILSFKPPKGRKFVERGSYPERFYGSAAQALVARIPEDTYPNLKMLMGQPWGKSSIIEEYMARYPGLKLRQAHPRTTVGFQSPSFEHEERVFSVEELLAMVLMNVADNAKEMAGKTNKIDGVVFTVPPYFTTQEKSSLELAADMAKLGVMSTISDGVAVGTHYATSREFPDVTEGGKPEIHMVFDVGAGYTSATVLKMQGRTIKDVGRFNKTVQEVIPLGSGWDRTLGGDSLNWMIVNDMVNQFIKTPTGEQLGKTAEEVLKSPRPAARLWKDAERLRQVLSANQETSASFEDLFPDVNFRYKLSRGGFEELAEAAGFYERLDAPFNAALKQANLAVEDLDSVILHGGATRTPFVMKRLEKLVKNDASKLKSNVNADEAAAFGAAFKAARLSPSFRVKDVRDYDLASYPVWMQYRKDGAEGKTQQQKVFLPTSQLTTSKTLKVPKYEDFELYLFQTGSNEAGSPLERSEGESRIGSRYISKNLTNTVESMKSKYGCLKENITTTVTIQLEQQYGFPELVNALVTCEVEAKEKKGVIDGMKDFLFGGEKKDDGQQVLQRDSSTTYDSMTGSSSATESSTTATESVKADKKSKKGKKDAAKDEANKEDPNKSKLETHTVKIEFDVQHDESLIVPYAEQKFIRERIRSFGASDKIRLEREEDLNNLESASYRIREILSDEEFTKYAQATTIKELEELVQSTISWLNDDKMSTLAPSEILKSKLKQLTGLTDPIRERKNQASRRGEVTVALQEALRSAKGMIDLVAESIKATEKTNKEMAEKAAKEAAEKEEAKTKEPASSETATDPLAELEEPDTTSSTAAEEATILPVPAVSPYTAEDLQDLLESHGTISEWLEDRLSIQESKKIWEDPAFKVEELEKKANDLNEAVMNVLTKSMGGGFGGKGGKGGKKGTKAKKPKPAKTIDLDDPPASFMAGAKKGGDHDEL